MSHSVFTHYFGVHRRRIRGCLYGPVVEFEAEVLAGLAPFACAELDRLSAEVRDEEETSVGFEWSGPPRELLALRTVVAVYALDSYPVPRPRGLLGEQHLAEIVGRIADVRTLDEFTSFRLSAAGRDSAVFERLAAEIAKRTGLQHDPDDGELLLRIRRGDTGWEVLSRLSPRPLSARAWRVRDRRGALNATIAAAMAAMTLPAAGDRFLNVGCGTGTLLVERSGAGPARRLVGVDIDTEVLDDAAANGARALVRGDAARLPFPHASFDVIAADLPYGATMGSPAENERLYPALLADAARVAVAGARFAVITHDIRRFESVLARIDAWDVVERLQVFQKGHHPTIWLLRRA